MSNELESLNDDQLSEVFAREVAGWTRGEYPLCVESKLTECWMTPFPYRGQPRFATSADAILPELEKVPFSIQRVRKPLGYIVLIELPSGLYVKREAATLARAACLALIVATRAIKEAAK